MFGLGPNETPMRQRFRKDFRAPLWFRRYDLGMSQSPGLVARKWMVLLALCAPLPVMGQKVASTAGSEASPVDCTFLGFAKSIRVERVAVAGDEQESGRKPTAFCTFARNGSELDASYFSDEGEDGRHAQHFRNFYDAQGQQREIDIFDDEDFKHSTRHVLSKRDAKGRVTESEDFDPDGTLNQRTVYRFNSSGDIGKEVSYGDTGQVEETTVRHFDSFHHVLREESSDVSTGRATETTYWYNGRGQEVKKLFRSPENSVLYLSTYDGEGRLSAFQTIVGNPPPAELPSTYGLCSDCGEFSGKTIYRYDRKGLLSELQVIQPPDRIVQLRRCEYDEHGYRTRDWTYQVDVQPKAAPIVTLSVDGRTVSFGRTNGLPLTSYTYDAHENWIKAVVTVLASDRLDSKRRVSEVLVRTITYY